MIPIVVVVAVPAVAVGIVGVAGLIVAALPVSRVISPAVMVGRYPDGAGIRRASPVSSMPLIVVAHRIPVTRYKRIPGTRASRLNSHDAHRRRRTNSDSHGELRKGSPRHKQ